MMQLPNLPKHLQDCLVVDNETEQEHEFLAAACAKCSKCHCGNCEDGEEMDMED